MSPRRRVRRGRRGQTVTIEEVAGRADVSVATVSRALRNLPNVAPETRERVVRAAEELRYEVDPFASRLATGRNDAVGVAMPQLGSWYFSTVASGVEDALGGSGLDLIVYSVRDEAARGRLLGRRTGLARLDGLVLIDLILGPGEVQDLAGQGLPFVTVGQRTEHFSSVTIDDVEATRTVTQHLIDLGHRRIALLGATCPDPLPYTVPAARRLGFRRALADAGVGADRSLEVPAAYTVEGGAAATRAAMSSNDPPTALLGLSDELAMGAMAALCDADVAVPDQVSVAGFDDHTVSGVLGLTTVRQDPSRIGATAAELLLESLASPTRLPRHVVSPTRFVQRSSTIAPPPANKQANRQVVWIDTP